MAQIKFYQNEDGVFFFGNRTANPGSIQLVNKSENSINFQITSGVDHFTEDLSIEDVLDKNGDPTYSSFEDIISKNKNFFLKAPASNGGGSKLDVLFVDAWFGEEGNYELLMDFTGATRISTEDDVVHMDVYSEIYGWQPISGSDPYVPISQTTIFVHPTTFERYRFNGTTMEVYNDVDNVVPKWLKYEALLTQTGEDAPVARVLNQDEPDYLGDIELTYDVDESVIRTSILFSDLIIVNFNPYYNAEDDSITYLKRLIDESGYLLLAFFDSTANGKPIYNSPFSIKKRVRGAPPKLLSAETNAAGDKVILTFDKKMSEFNLYDEIIGAGSLSTGNHTISGYIYNNNIIILELSEPFVYLEEDGVINSSTRIESFDYGLLQPFENFPVINKVV